MPFYVDQPTMSRLSGRTRQSLLHLRNSGALPFITTDEGKKLSDIDDPKVRRVIMNPPESVHPVAVAKAEAFREEFEKKRAAGEITCSKSGYVDYMSSVEGTVDGVYPTSTEDERLDLLKKRLEVDRLGKTIEKMDVAMKALTGDLIDRTYVESWISRYVGILHKQILELSATGIGDDIYNMIKREPDGMAAIKSVEKLLEQRLSGILKDGVAAMKANQL